MDKPLRILPYKKTLVVLSYAALDFLGAWASVWVVDTWLGLPITVNFYAPGLALLLLPVLFILGLYPGIGLAPDEVIRRLFQGVASWAALNFLVAFLKDRDSIVLLFVSYLVMAGWVFLFLYVGRALLRHQYQNQPWWGIPVVVVGAGNSGKALIRSLKTNRGLGFRPVAAFDDDPTICPEGNFEGIPVFHGVGQVGKFVGEHPVQTAMVAMPQVERALVSTLVDTHLVSVPRVILILDTPGLMSFGMRPRDLGGIFVYEAEQRLMLPLSKFAKRSIEWLLTFSGLLVTSWLLLLIALLVKLDSRGPVFYRHPRVGRNGKPFKAWKFRTMHSGSDILLQHLLAGNDELRREWELNHKLRNDPRVTRVGALLRKTSLDEIPQFFNILSGDMSLIGPRPIVPGEVEKFGTAFELINSVRPGLTGFWQVSGRSDTDYEQRVLLDSYYVRSWSVWLDAYIFLKTFAVLVTGRGAY